MMIFVNGAPGVSTHSLQGLLMWQGEGQDDKGKYQLLSMKQPDPQYVLSNMAP